MITREQALAFIMQHQRLAERDFLMFAKEMFRKQEGTIPPNVRAKFLQAGDQYGAFKIGEDWMAQFESEVWDGVMYCGLERLRLEVGTPVVIRCTGDHTCYCEHCTAPAKS